MPKVKYPPQGGEKNLCLTLFCTMMLSVISAVAIIYAIVIVYIPSAQVLKSTLEGPKMCTTLSKAGNLTGIDVCDKWSSCEEWCLSKSPKECSHVYAAVRELGTTVYWDGCDMPLPAANATDEESVLAAEMMNRAEDCDHIGDHECQTFIDHDCNILEDLEELNCKLYKYEKDENGLPGVKEICLDFDDVIISCESGICKNVSEVYSCNYTSKLDDLFLENDGAGSCSCNNCFDSDRRSDKYEGCNDKAEVCFATNATKNSPECEKYTCSPCPDICHARGECFDMSSRKDPTKIGQDEYGISKQIYYECSKGKCSEIYDLKCERRCNSRTFNTKDKNSVIFIGERLVMAQCAKRSTTDVSSIDQGSERDNTLMVACTNVTMDHESGTMITEDCVNGTWFKGMFNEGTTNYSHLTKVYLEEREKKASREPSIAYEEDIIIYNETKMKINIEGCVNTLAMECMAFYYDYGKDGRNYTARAVYPCYYDPYNPDYVVITFNPDKTLMLLIFFVAIPFSIMIVSCFYMCLCSKFIEVADDGHMRLMCCGKAVTGIGNVPKWEPVVRSRRVKDEDEDEEEDVVQDRSEAELIQNNEEDLGAGGGGAAVDT